jgi:hypothetical protein
MAEQEIVTFQNKSVESPKNIRGMMHMSCLIDATKLENLSKIINLVIEIPTTA